MANESEGHPPCKNYGEDDGEGGIVCLNQSDPRYTMDFTEVQPGAFIHWCAKCGPFEHRMLEALNERADADPAFLGTLKAAIDAATDKRRMT